MNFSLILCRDFVSGGIGINNKIPWTIQEDMEYFKLTTIKNIVIMGKNTFLSLKRPLVDRVNIVVSSNFIPPPMSEVVVFKSLDDSLLYANRLYPKKRIFVIGGERLFRESLSHKSLESIYINRILFSSPIVYDVYFNDKIPDRFYKYSSDTIHNSEKEYFLIKEIYNIKLHTEEKQYMDLLKKVLSLGETKIDRTNVGTISLFGNQIEFDVSTYFPLLTTKRVAFRVVFEELMWFLRGQTDNKILNSKNVNIWNGNSSREYMTSRGLEYEDGELGPIYGAQWRNFGGIHDTSIKNHISTGTDGIDQIKRIIKDLQENPDSRRLIVSAWNPKDIDKMSLPPCFTEDCIVNTLEGYKPIKSVLSTDYLLTHKNRFDKISSIQTREYSGNFYNIKTYYSSTVTTTEKHPFYCVFSENVIDTINMEKLDISWVNACDLTKNHYIGVNIHTPSSDSITKYMSNHVMYIVGYFHACGYLNSRRGIVHLTYTKKMCEFLKFNHITYKLREDKTIIEICSIELYDVCKKDNLEWVYKSENINYFIEGFNSVYSKQVFSHEKCLYLQTIMLYRNIVLSITKISSGYRLSILNKHFFIKEGYLWVKVKSISSFKDNKTVYNFSVENDNSYCVNNLIVHNCHMIWQLFRRGEYIDCKLNLRSNDLFLGAPFNIASYSLLLYIVCSFTKYKPGRLIYSIGDAHIYKNHIEAVKTQLSRPLRTLPTLKIVNKKENIEDYEYSDFKLFDYNPHDTIRGEMAV